MAAVKTLAEASFLDQAACTTADAHVFAPKNASGQFTTAAIAAAKRICGRCPVTDECLAWAVHTGQRGIWGGTTPAERRDIPPSSLRPTARRKPEMKTADEIAKDLRDGMTVKDAAMGGGWTRQAVTALIHGRPGWFLDARTDTVRIAAPGPAPAKAAPPAVSGAEPKATAPAKVTAVSATEPAGTRGSVDELLAAAADVDAPRIARALVKAVDAIATLRTLHTEHVAAETARREREEQLAAEQERIRRLEEELAEARSKVKELGGGPKKPSTAPRSKTAQIRQWAKSEGLDVNEHGRVPTWVITQYEAAHQAVAS